MKTWNRLLALPLILCAAQAHCAEVTVAAPANDNTNFEGDRIWFYSPHKVWVRDINGKVTEACIEPHQPMLGRRKSSLKDGEKEMTGWMFDAVDSRFSKPDGQCPAVWTDAKKYVVKVQDSVFVPDADLQAADRARVGWTFGTLVVPYKYQMRGDKEFSPSASLGGYLGWRFEQTQPLSMKVGVFAGATVVPIAARDANGKPTEQINNHAAFSAGLAFLGAVKNSFQLGLVVGVDHAGKGANYVNQNKPWVAIALGYDFAN